MLFPKNLGFIAAMVLGFSAVACRESKREYDKQNVVRVANKSDSKITLHYREACADGCMDVFATREISSSESVVINLSVSTHDALSGATGTIYSPVKIDISAKSGAIVACEADPFPDTDYSQLELMEEVTYTFLAPAGVCPQNTRIVTLVE